MDSSYLQVRGRDPQTPQRLFHSARGATVKKGIWSTLEIWGDEL